MKPQPPLLPEATFTALHAAKLEAMIDIALSHPQQQATPPSGNVVAFRHHTLGQRLAYSGGMAAMAASVMLAFLLTPQVSGTASTTVAETSSSADFSDMLLYDSLGA